MFVEGYTFLHCTVENTCAQKVTHISNSNPHTYNSFPGLLCNYIVHVYGLLGIDR